MTKHFNKKTEKELRRELRNNATKAEQLLWKHIKGKKLGGYKFRRQYSVDQFIIDFYCPVAKLAIEVDGPTHVNSDIEIYDEERQKHLETFGISFLRIDNSEIYENIDSVLTLINEKIIESTTP